MQVEECVAALERTLIWFGLASPSRSDDEKVSSQSLDSSPLQSFACLLAQVLHKNQSSRSVGPKAGARRQNLLAFVSRLNLKLLKVKLIGLPLPHDDDDDPEVFCSSATRSSLRTFLLLLPVFLRIPHPPETRARNPHEDDDDNGLITTPKESPIASN